MMRRENIMNLPEAMLPMKLFGDDETTCQACVNHDVSVTGDPCIGCWRLARYGGVQQGKDYYESFNERALRMKTRRR